MTEIDFAPMMEAVARDLLGDPNPHLSTPGELRFGNHGSISVDLEKGSFFDHEQQVGGGVLKLVEERLGVTGGEAMKWLRERGHPIPEPERRGGEDRPRPARPRPSKPREDRPPPAEDRRPEPRQAARPTGKRRIVATYPYNDEEGVLRYEVVRYEPKRFAQRRPVVSGSTSGPWVWGLRGQAYFRLPGRSDWLPRRSRDERPAEEVAEFPEEERILYRLGDVLNAIEDGETIFVVEGEKDVHNLQSLGLVATCNPGGSGKWGAEYSAQLAGGDVVVLADNDEVGDKHAEEVCRSLRGKAKRVRRVDLPGLPPKGDVSDFLEAGGDLAAIRGAVDGASDWAPDLPLAPFPVVRFGDMREYRPFGEWLVRNWIGRGQLVAVYGPPKQGKSFLTIDLGARIAHGWTWFGLPTQRSVVIYNAAEGGEGVKKRLAAWANAPGRTVDPSAPFFMVPTVLDLFSDETATDALIAYARAVSDALGAPVGAIFVDTLARAMVGGDENSAVDMGRLIAAADRIKTATGATVILVHHSGKDVGRGMRGHSSLLGAVDGAISVAKVMLEPDKSEKGAEPVWSGEIEVRLQAQKDGEDGLLQTIRLDRRIIGRDADGAEVSSCIVTDPAGRLPEGASSMSGGDRRIADRLTQDVRKAFSVLLEATKTDPRGTEIDGRPAVHWLAWVKGLQGARLLPAGGGNDDRRERNIIFEELRRPLVVAGLVKGARPDARSGKPEFWIVLRDDLPPDPSE